jgi:7-cyano-7-deazaguanine reductase
MVKRSKSTYEDLQNNIRMLKMPLIEVWNNKYPDRDYTVYLDIPECTCICPKTGLPDFVQLKIAYIPTKTCVELKSLKLYIVAYRDVGIFHEHLVNKIMDDMVQACSPKWARVEGIVSPRGGIQTTVVSEYHKKKNKK